MAALIVESVKIQKILKIYSLIYANYITVPVLPLMKRDVVLH